MHNIDLILTLTSGLVAALTLGDITHRLGLSPIVDAGGSDRRFRQRRSSVARVK